MRCSMVDNWRITTTSATACSATFWIFRACCLRPCIPPFIGTKIMAQSEKMGWLWHFPKLFAHIAKLKDNNHGSPERPFPWFARIPPQHLQHSRGNFEKYQKQCLIRFSIRRLCCPNIFCKDEHQSTVIINGNVTFLSLMVRKSRTKCNLGLPLSLWHGIILNRWKWSLGSLRTFVDKWPRNHTIHCIS